MLQTVAIKDVSNRDQILEMVLLTGFPFNIHVAGA